MSKLKLKGRDLRAIGFPESPAISIAINIMEKLYRHKEKQQGLEDLKKVLAAPREFAGDENFCKIAAALLPKPRPHINEISLRKEGIPFSIFGEQYIETGALEQMKQAAKLPITVAAALMPDAHQGYGLPIGGVLATDNSVIPYGVGVDIGCRMCMSVFSIDAKIIAEKENYLTRIIQANTLFGAGKEFKKKIENPVLERNEFNEIGLLRQLHTKAASQLGTSGSGNHFVEFGIVDVAEADEILSIPAGKYLGLLSHSGSRGLGANIANHYTRIAKQKRMLPREAVNLSWFTLDEDEGIEYWKAMNLAGDYASACHHVIHEKIAKEFNVQPLKIIENHHNFAWKETHEGKEVIVHRKGATPAGKNVLGIIPGSMTAPGFIVKGKGSPASLASAAHGAGRMMSRTAAMKILSYDNINNELKKHGVKLIGGGLDEAPQAYKDINLVMKFQHELVDIAGVFYPKIVRMDG